MTKDEEWMKIAIRQAKFAETQGEVPVGAVIVKDNFLLSKGYNQPIETNDPTAHAEIQAIRAACKTLNNYRISGSTIFITLEPCMMCFGAIIHSRIERIVFGAYDKKKGICSASVYSQNIDLYKNQIKITGGVLENQSSQLLKKFFMLRR